MNFTPDHLLVDAQGRPYFLWDLDMTLEAFRALLCDPDADVQAYFAAKLLRQAKPDDVFRFLTLEEIGRLWPRIRGSLGWTGPFWTWLLGEWKVIAREEE